MIDFPKYELKPEYFNYQSHIHGIQHTYRVMLIVLKLGELLDCPRETELAFYAAFIHDMARKNDGDDPDHGLRAAKTKIGYLDLNKKDLREVQTAVYNHCQKNDIMKEHPHWKTAMILKDADLLDRVRLGTEINYKKVRFAETLSLKDLSMKLQNVNMNIHVFENLISRNSK